MKKKGMISEIHRQSSEDKWYKIIKSIDDGGVWDGDDYIIVCGDCGYCEDVKERLGDISLHICETSCYLTNKYCSNNPDSMFKAFTQAMGGGKTKARKYAVKIYDYIKNDKPEVK